MSERVSTVCSVLFGIVLLTIILVMTGIIPKFWKCDCSVPKPQSSLMMEFCHEVVSKNKEYCRCLRRELSSKVPYDVVEDQLTRFKKAYDQNLIDEENTQTVIRIIKTIKVIDTSGVCNSHKR